MRRPDPRWMRSRSRLRAAALRLAARGPIEDVSMGTVASEAEVSRSTAYLHASSARELLEDALRTELDHVRHRRLHRVPRSRLAAASEAAAFDVISHVERHADVYRAGLVQGNVVHTLLRDHIEESVRMLLAAHRLGPAAVPEGAEELASALAARGMADAAAGQIAVWVNGPEPRDVEVFLAVNRQSRPAWWPDGS